MPTHVELWHWIMDVQHQLASAQPRNDTGQNENVRHVVNVNHIQPATEVQLSEFQTAQQAGHEILKKISQEVPSLPADSEAVNVNAVVNSFAGLPVSSHFLRQGNDVDFKAIARQGLRLSPNPGIR